MSYCIRLVDLKRRSLRRGIWHSVLSGLERAQVDLTVRLVKVVRSRFLARVLDRLVNKLSSALESKVSRLIRSVGFPAALRLSSIAQRWGYKAAQTWSEDLKFARFLAIIEMNSSYNQNSDGAGS
jgi:hypothetical protein